METLSFNPVAVLEDDPTWRAAPATAGVQPIGASSGARTASSEPSGQRPHGDATPASDHQSTAHAPSTTPPEPAVTVSGAAREGEIQVYTADFGRVLNLPRSAVHHVPPAKFNVTRLVLCTNYDSQAEDPAASCGMGDQCKFVHADTRQGREHEIHVNYAWRTLDEVTYARFAPGEVLMVAPPNSKNTSDHIDSGMALATQALASSRRPLSHCAHYFYNRTCNLGADCRFIHAVCIDPEAREHQRAPVPATTRGGSGSSTTTSTAQQQQQQQRRPAAASPVPRPHQQPTPDGSSVQQSVSGSPAAQSPEPGASLLPLANSNRPSPPVAAPHPSVVILDATTTTYATTSSSSARDGGVATPRHSFPTASAVYTAPPHQAQPQAAATTNTTVTLSQEQFSELTRLVQSQARQIEEQQKQYDQLRQAVVTFFGPHHPHHQQLMNQLQPQQQLPPPIAVILQQQQQPQQHQGFVPPQPVSAPPPQQVGSGATIINPPVQHIHHQLPAVQQFQPQPPTVVQHVPPQQHHTHAPHYVVTTTSPVPVPQGLPPAQQHQHRPATDGVFPVHLQPAPQQQQQQQQVPLHFLHPGLQPIDTTSRRTSVASAAYGPDDSRRASVPSIPPSSPATHFPEV